MNRPESLNEVARLTRTQPAKFRLWLNEFLDDFYLSSPTGRQRRIAEKPDFLGDPRIDAWLCAVGEHLARRWRLPMPEWVFDPAGKGTAVADYSGFGPEMIRMRKLLDRESPSPFRRRNIFVEAEPLTRARFPGLARRRRSQAER